MLELKRTHFGIVRFLIQKILVKAISVGPEERLFWQAMMHDLLDQLTRADLASWLGKILILQSDDDPATKPARRQALRNLYPQAQTHTFQGAGHTPFLSQPDEFYPLVHAFLQEP